MTFFNPVTAIQGKHVLATCTAFLQIPEPNLHFQARLDASGLTTVWENGLLLYHFKVPGTRVGENEENEALFVELHEIM